MAMTTKPNEQDPTLVDVDLAHALAPVCAKDLEGNAVRFGTLWEERPAVLVFLRHFG